MNSPPAVRDIQTYLRDSGWEQQPQTWRDATIWSRADGHEVLVPPRDDLADTELRLEEILGVLTTVERRPVDEIIEDINAPFDDIQLYRTFPGDDSLLDGHVPLTVALRGLQGVRDMVSVAARTVVEGPLPFFPRGAPERVTELLQHVQLGPGRADKYIFAVRVPVDGRSPSPDDASPVTASEGLPLGRQVARQLYQAMASARTAATRATQNDLTPFDESVATGVSANFCDALSALAGRRYQEPFDITFRWARGLSSDIPADTIHFTGEAGRIIRAAAVHLRQQSTSGRGTVTGLIDSLHDQAQGTDRWRIKVRGTVTGGRGSDMDRTVWIRLDNEESYDRAISAHRAQQRVRATGELTFSGGRTELNTTDGGFTVMDN